MKARSRANCRPVQMRRPEDKRPRPVGKPARALCDCGRLEDPRIRTIGAQFTRRYSGTVRDAGDAPENRSKGASQNVRRFSFGEMRGLLRYEGKSQRLQPESQP